MPWGGPAGGKRRGVWSLLGSPWTSVTLLVLLFMSVAAQAWGLTLFGTRVDHDDFGTWSDAVGSVTSSGALIVAVGSLAADRRRRAEERREARVSEITRVYCWLEPRRSETRTVTWVLHFENLTNAVVAPWRVRIRWGGAPIVLGSTEYGPIRPQTTELLLTNVDGGSGGQPQLEFEFTDADRQAWRSDDQGLRAA